MRTKTILLCLLLSNFFSAYMQAADIIFVSPVKSDVLLLYFREGEKNTSECQGYATSGCPDIWNSGPLDATAAKNAGTYFITSTDDEDYTSAVNPSSIGYKSKREAALGTYWVYLQLPESLKEGHSYTIQWGSLASNKSSETFVFKSRDLRSEAIHVNQVGYAPNAGMKYAYVYQWMGTAGGTDFSTFEGNPFYLVRNSDSAVVYSSADHGKGLQLRKHLQLENTGSSNVGWHGSDIWECDFSDIGNSVAVAPGEYRIAIDGIGCSFPFSIDKEVYSDLYYLLVRGLYHQRSGPARTQEYTDFVKPVDHTPGVNGFQVTYSNHLFIGNDDINFEQLPAQATEWVWPDNPYPHMNDEADGWGWGGHFDAADYDRSRSHLNVSSSLMFVYEMNPGKFHDGELNIPESDNNLPDILDEGQWDIDFYRRLKGPTGGICGGVETTGYYHPSWLDNHMWYAYAEEAITSWAYSGAAAQLAYCYELAGADQADIDNWVQEAVDAYNWAEAKSPGNPGRSYIEQKYYAAASLYRMTGDHKYMDDFAQCRTWYSDLDAANGTYVFCLTPPDRWPNFTTADKTLQNSLIASVENLAWQQGINQAEDRALRLIKYSNPNLSWGGYYPNVMLQMLCHHLSDDDEILDLLYTTADFYLGESNDQQVFITGAGSVNADRLLRDILHIDSNYDGVPGWIPGIPPYKFASTVFNDSYFFEPSDPHNWPLMEQCIDARDYIPAAEFTVQETVAPMAALFSYLEAYTAGKQFLISIDEPAEDSVYVPGSDVAISVSASVSEGTISKVEFYNGTSKMGEDTDAPYEFTFSALPAGVYSISVVAYSENENKRSQPVTLVVDDQAPTDPVNLHITGVAAVRVDLAWDPSTDDAGVKEYQVFMNDELQTTSILPECSVEGLTADTRYSFYVKAADYAGTISGPSNVVDTVTKTGKQIPGRIQGEDFDEVSGEVASEASGDTDSTDYVGWFDEGESLGYAVNVESAGDYLVTFRVARGIDAGNFEFLSGTSLLATISVPNTGGWGQWADVYKVVHLGAGQQSLYINNTGNPFNVNWMEFEHAVATQGITIDNCPPDSLEPGNSYLMQATVSPEDASDKSVTWSSANEEIATVDQEGNVTAVSIGFTDIIAVTNYGDFQATCNINVYKETSGTANFSAPTFGMYPNPVNNGVLTLSGEMLRNSGVYITGTDGRVVYYKKCDTNTGSISIQTGKFGTGIYIVRVVNGGSTATGKLVIN